MQTSAVGDQNDNQREPGFHLGVVQFSLLRGVRKGRRNPMEDLPSCLANICAKGGCEQKAYNITDQTETLNNKRKLKALNDVESARKWPPAAILSSRGENPSGTRELLLIFPGQSHAMKGTLDRAPAESGGSQRRKRTAETGKKLRCRHGHKVYSGRREEQGT